MTSNHNYEFFNGGCHGMAANVPQVGAVRIIKLKIN